MRTLHSEDNFIQGEGLEIHDKFLGQAYETIMDFGTRGYPTHEIAHIIIRTVGEAEARANIELRQRKQEKNLKKEEHNV